MSTVSYENRLWNIRQFVVQLMEQQGRITDKTICELCLREIDGNRYNIHHTKYEGATFYDLLIVCPKCNSAPENKYLK